MQEIATRAGHTQGAGHGVPLAYQYPVVSGTVPVARWAFASAAVGTFLYVYGGVGPSVLDDLAVLDGELMVWRSLTPTAPRPKDRPDKLHAAAMCAVGNTLWLFGGQQGRKHLRTLYALNTEMLSWRLVTPAGACPAGREGHSFTAVNGQLAYLFGGQGKKLFNDFFVLRQGGSEWVELKPRGPVPSPRSGHSMVWDGQDDLICFGGTTAGSSDNSMFRYSLSRNEWSIPECSGTIPSPRTHHTAVLLPSRNVLVFGGCNAAGVFFNDAYVLNLDTMHWSRAQPLSTPPPPRYHHCCHVLGSKVALYGGINPKQAFDAVVLLETSFGSDLSAVAEELARMTGGSASAGGSLNRAAMASAAAASSAALGSGGVSSGVPLVGDLMKLQLRDLLVKRNMEELHITAQQKAEAVEVKLKEETAAKVALQKEVLQLKLISTESEQENKTLREQVAEAKKALDREQAEHAATSVALSDIRNSLISREQQLSEARQLLDSMSAELGILSSRYHRLQQERDALRTARRQQQQQLQQQQQQQFQQLQQQQQQEQEPPLQQQQHHRFVDQTSVLGASGGAAVQLQQRNLSAGSSASSGAHDLDVVDGRSGIHRAVASLDRSDSQPIAADCLSRSPRMQLLPSDVLIGQAAVLGASSVAAIAAAGDTSSHGPLLSAAASSTRDSSPAEQHADVTVHDVLDPGTDEVVPLCEHNQLQAACLLCICQRFLAATASSCNHLAPGSLTAVRSGSISSSSSSAVLSTAAGVGPSTGTPSAAGLATVAIAACANETAQYRQFLSISELARNRLEAENATLQQQVTDLQTQVDQQQQQLRVLQAQPAALSACSIEELNALEGRLEASTKAVRQVVLQRSIAEYQAQANADSQRCAVCMEHPKRLAFNCGHQTCRNCGDKISACPFCRQDITAKIRLFE